MLSSLQQSGQSLLRAAAAVLLLGCMVLNCLQMSNVFQIPETAAVQHHHGMTTASPGPAMAHDCCEPDSSHCPLEVPLVKLFVGADAPQFFSLFWLLPLAVSLAALSLLRQLLYRLVPFPVWRSCLPSYPRLHIQQQVFLN